MLFKFEDLFTISEIRGEKDLFVESPNHFSSHHLSYSTVFNPSLVFAVIQGDRGDDVIKLQYQIEVWFLASFHRQKLDILKFVVIESSCHILLFAS